MHQSQSQHPEDKDKQLAADGDERKALREAREAEAASPSRANATATPMIEHTEPERYLPQVWSILIFHHSDRANRSIDRFESGRFESGWF